ncbi:MAG: S-layer homology domain-containing protein, partial [Clostridia bacterium]|nr:S-layer homology domain-containing protein [Clostridia bacterium]
MKKVLSLLVVVSMLVSILPATVSATHWADEDVKYLVENGAIAEDDAMLQNLDTPITRSQMVKVIVALLDGDEPIEGKEYFTDISPEDTHIAKAAENGFVNGFGDGTFRPNNPITRQDFFTIVGRAYELTGEATNEFTDNDSIADYAKPYVDALQGIGIVNGYGDGTVNPRGNITIAETLAVMHRTDEHVKTNTPEEQPKEEEKKPTGSSGGGGGGYVGGGNHPTGVPNPTPKVKMSVEVEEDCTGKYVGYLTVEVIDRPSAGPIQKIMLLKEGDYSFPDVPLYAGVTKPKMDKAETFGQYIAEENGKYALPDFGKYELHILASNVRWSQSFTVNPPISSDNTAPELDLEVVNEEGSSTYPCTFKVTATDGAGIARIDYVKSTGLISKSDRPAEMN